MDDRHLNYVKKFLNKTLVGGGGGGAGGGIIFSHLSQNLSSLILNIFFGMIVTRVAYITKLQNKKTPGTNF